MNNKNLQGLFDKVNLNLNALQGTYEDFNKKLSVDFELDKKRKPLTRSPEMLVDELESDDQVWELKQNIIDVGRELQGLKERLKLGIERGESEWRGKISQRSKLDKVNIGEVYSSYYTKIFTFALDAVGRIEDKLKAFPHSFESLARLAKSCGSCSDFSNQEKIISGMSRSSGFKRLNLHEVRKGDKNEVQEIINRMSSTTERGNWSLEPERETVRFSYSEESSKLARNLQDENLRLRAQIRGQEEKLFEMIELKSTLEQSQNDNSQLHYKLIKLEQKLHKKKAKSSQLLKLLEGTQHERKSLKSSIEAQEKLKVKNNELEDRLEFLIEENKDRSITVKDLNAKLVRIEKENKRLASENKNLREALEEVSEKFRKMKDDGSFQRIEEENKDMKAGIEEAQSQLNERLHENEKLHAKVNELNKVVKDKEGQIEGLRREYQKVKTELGSKQESLGKLNEDLDRLGRSEKRHKELCDEHKKKIEELEKLNLDLEDQIAIKLKHSKSQPSPSLRTLKQYQESLESDNQTLLESQAFITDYVKNMKSSHTQQISELKSALSASEKNVLQLSQALECQTYLYNKQEKERKSLQNPFSPSASPSSHRLSRQKTSPSLDAVDLKSIETLRKLFDQHSFEPNLVAMIGIELNEEDPENFLGQISQIKQERDTYYLAAQKYEDLINELKSELNEEDEFQILRLVMALNKKTQV